MLEQLDVEDRAGADRPAPLQHPLARAAQRGQAGRSIRSQRSCEGADHRRRRPARPPTSSRAAGRRRRPVPSATTSSTSPTTAAVERAFAEVEPDVVFNCAAFHNVDVCETRARTEAWAVNVRAVQSLAALRGAQARPRLDQLRLRRRAATSPTARTTCPHPRVRLRADQARRRVRGARLRRGRAGRPHRRPLRDPRQRLQGRQLRAAHGRARHASRAR